VLRQRSISAIGIVLFAAIPAFVGGYVFAAAMLILAVAGIHEAITAYVKSSFHPFRAIALVSGGAVLATAAFESPESSLYWLISLVLLASLTGMLVRQTQDGLLVDWALTFSTVIYVSLPLFLAVALRGLGGDSTQHWTTTVAGWFRSPGEGLAWVGVVFSVTWLNDTAAYLVGRQFGHAKLAPHLSPGKTRVGAIAGIVAGTITGAGASWLFGAPISVELALLTGFILSIAGQAGDLAESAIKRSLGIKDMGSLIPGHGGVLDRIDALLFTFPVTFMLVQLFVRMGWL
jgi:phosphatidate cytidylyltransferase